MRSPLPNALRVVPPKPEVQIVQLSPADACCLIATSIAGERNLRPATVDKYLRLMQTGKFRLGWDAITITVDGKRVNAHHRLAALAKMPEDYRAEFILLTDAHPDIHLIGDEGRKRDDAGRAKRRFPNKKHHVEREACFSRLYDIVVSSSHDVGYEEKHEKLDAKYKCWVEKVLKIPASEDGRDTGVDSNVRAALAYALGFPQWHQEVLEFIEALKWGARGKSAGKALREVLKSAEGRTYTPTEKLQMTLYAVQWHLGVRPKRVTGIKFGHRQSRAFPRGEYAPRYDAAVAFFKDAAQDAGT